MERVRQILCHSSVVAGDQYAHLDLPEILEGACEQASAAASAYVNGRLEKAEMRHHRIFERLGAPQTSRSMAEASDQVLAGPEQFEATLPPGRKRKMLDPHFDLGLHQQKRRVDSSPPKLREDSDHCSQQASDRLPPGFELLQASLDARRNAPQLQSQPHSGRGSRSSIERPLLQSLSDGPELVNCYQTTHHPSDANQTGGAEIPPHSQQSDNLGNLEPDVLAQVHAVLSSWPSLSSVTSGSQMSIDATEVGDVDWLNESYIDPFLESIVFGSVDKTEDSDRETGAAAGAADYFDQYYQSVAGGDTDDLSPSFRSRG
jgi:hypothetical protein